MVKSMSNDKLIECAGLDDRISIGYVARSALKHEDPKVWLTQIMLHEKFPGYVRYLAHQMIRIIERPETEKK